MATYSPDVRDSAIARIVEKWRSADVDLGDSLTERDIREFEERNRVSIPSDLAQFLLAANGMSAECADPQTQIRFWNLGEYRRVIDELPELRVSEDLFVFADYSIWVHGYATDLGVGKGEVFIVGDEDPIEVASSFLEFLEMCLVDSSNLYGA